MRNTFSRLVRPLLLALAACTAFGPLASVAAAAPMQMTAAQIKPTAQDLVDQAIANEDAALNASVPAPNAAANSANYVFTSTLSGSLVDMSSGTTTLIAADQDDTASAVTLLGFDFYFNGTRQDRFSVNSNGSLRFGAAVISTTLYDPLAQAGQALITAYGADQRTHAGNGKVHFKVTGTAPNRVAVIEWLNEQADFNAGGTADLTYQVHLYETTGEIEFAYGSMNLSTNGAADPNSVSPQFGFSSNNAVGTVGSLSVAQSGTPPPSYNGGAAAPVNNTFVAGSIPALSSATDGSRRTFAFTPGAVVPPGAPLTFTGVSATGMTLNWTDSPNESGYSIYLSTDGTNFIYYAGVAQDTTSLAVTGLLGGTTYSWRVLAFNEGDTAYIAASHATNTPTPNSSLGSGLWSAPGTWSTGSVPTTNDAVTISANTTVTIDTASTAYSVTVAGTLQFEQITARSLNVGTDVTVQAGATLQSNPVGTQTGHNLSLAGNLLNNGALHFSTDADTAGANITFVGATSASFGGTGATTDVRSITLNKGTSAVSTLTLSPTNFTVRGVTTDTVAGGWLVLTNGTFQLAGTFTGTSRVFGAAAYTIPASAGFWLKNPNYTVAGQTGSPTNSGLLRVSQGTFNIGTGTGNSLGFAAGSMQIIEGGAVNATGRFGVAAAANAITYLQTGGTVTVCTVGNTSATLASFDLGTSLTSAIALSGGTIVTQLAATAIDYRDQAGSGIAGVTGGTLQLGNAASGAAKTFNLRGVLPNVAVTNTSAGHTGVMSTTLVNFNNIALNMLINAGATFNSGNTTFLMAGASLVNNGTLTANGASSNFIWFDSGLGTHQNYSGSGATTAPVTSMAVQSAGLTLSSSTQFITSRINVFVGGITGADKLTLGTGAATSGVIQIGNTSTPTAAGGFDAAPVFNLGSGGQIVSYLRTTASRTTGPEINPARTLTNFTYDDNDATHTLTINGVDLAVTGTTALTNGRVITGSNTLILGSAGTLTRTTGYVDGNLRKPVAAAAAVTFETGTANGYTPVTFNVTAGTFPTTITAAAVQTVAPGIAPLSLVISRYWALTASGITADLTFNYLDADVPASVTEANLHVYAHESGAPSDYADQGGVINTTANTAVVSGVSSFSAWTLAQFDSELSITISDGVNTLTPGGSTTYTITASNAGPGDNAAAVVTDTFPGALTCNTTCSATLGGNCTAGPVAGNLNQIASIPAGGAVTYTAVCSVSGAASGTINNSATVAGGSTPDSNTADNQASDSDTVAAAADLGISNTDGVTTATPGGSVTYSITASNAGPSDAPGATVADTFPASETCTWTCSGVGGGTCTAAGSGNLNQTVNLPAGGSTTFFASCTISASATGLLVNNATVTPPAGVSDGNPTNNLSSDTDTLSASANLGITNTDGVTTATPGGSVTYSIIASNAGPSNASGATVSDTFPANETCTWTCTGAGGGTCTAAGSGNITDTVNLPSGASTTYSATCSISASASGSLSNIAIVGAPAGVTDPTPGNNSAGDTDTLSASADLGITLTDGVTTATPGGSVTYTITATNAGPSNASGANVSDTFPASETCTWTCTGAGGGTCPASGSGNINGTVTLPSGGSTTYSATCSISASASGALNNTATITAPGGVADPALGNNTASDTDALGASVDLGITNTDGVLSATPGGSVTYTITASNAGPSDATGASVADAFPAGETCTWTCVGTSGGTCTAAGSGSISDTVNLPGGAGIAYTATCAIASSATGTLSNIASITAPANATDPTPGNNAATDTDTLDAATDLSITNTDGVTTATIGGSVTYTITASNGGPSDVTGATVADTFPASETCSWTCAGSGGGTCSASGSGTIGDTVNLPAGASAVYTATCSISAAASGALSNTASITAPVGAIDANPGNNSATDTDTLQPAPGAILSATKSVSGTGYAPGSAIVYSVVISNSGTAAQGDNPGDEFTDSMPAGLTLLGETATTGTATGSGGVVHWNGTLAVGASVTITINATINSNASGSIVNQGMVFYDADGNGSNESSALTADPAVAGATAPTAFTVAAVAAPVVPIPALDWRALLLLGLILATSAAAQRRRRY